MVRLISFGFRQPGGVPQASRIFEARHFPNPYYDKALRALNGLHEKVQKDLLIRGAGALISEIVLFCRDSPEAVVGIGCSFGRHRSVAITELVAVQLRPFMNVEIEHRDLGLIV